jgi:AsmA protein
MKKLLIGLGVVVALLIVAVIALPFLVPVSVVRERIVAGVKEATGRDLKIGEMSVSVLPSLAVEAKDVAFANAPGAAEPNMATLKSLKAGLKLMPLLSGEVAIDRFVLVEPVIRLEVDKQGKANWEFPAAKDGKPEAQASDGGGAGGLQQLRLGEVRLENGTISYFDARTGARHEATKLDLDIDLPSLDEPLKATGQADWRGKTVKLAADVAKPRALIDGQTSELAFQLDSEPVKLDLKGQATASTPFKLAGAVDLNVPSVRNLAAWAAEPIQFQGEGLGPLRIKGQLGLEGPKATFSNAEIALDAIKAKGELLVDTGQAKPFLRGRLDVEKLDLNPYLPPEQPAQQQPGAGGGQGGGGGWSEEPIDLAGLKAANADFTLSVGAIQFRKIQIGKGTVSALLKDGRLTATLAELALYGGAGQGRVVLDGSGATPAVDANMRLAGVQIEPLLKDAADFDRLSGSGSTELQVSGRGKSQKAIVASLDGKGGIDFRDGAIKGFNLAEMVRNIGSSFTTAGPQKTDFSELTASYVIQNGVLTNKDLQMKSPLLRIEGAGTANLAQRTLDYKVTPKAVASLTGQGGRQDLAGVMVPVLIQGPWDNLSFRPDLEGLVKQQLDPGKLLEGKVPGGLPIPGVGGGSAPAQQPGGQTGQPSSPLGGATDALKGLLGKTK